MPRSQSDVKPSNEFSKIMGCNVLFPDSLNEYERNDIKCALIEHMVTALQLDYRDENFAILHQQGLLAAMRNVPDKIWNRLHFYHDIPKTAIGRYCAIYKCTKRTATLNLASLMGLTDEQLFGNNSKKVPCVWTKQEQVEFCTAFCKYDLPDSIRVDKVNFTKNNEIVIFTPLKKERARIICYRNPKGQEFHIPLQVATFQSSYNTSISDRYTMLYPGVGAAPYPLFNANKIENHAQGVTVFLCEDLRVAIALDKFIKPEIAIATSCYGGSKCLEHVDFTGFWGKDVIFIPAVRKSSFKDIAVLAMLEKEEVRPRSLKIVHRAVLSTPMVKHDTNALDDPWEKYMVENAIVVDSQNIVDLNRLSADAVERSGFEHWQKQIGLTRHKIFCAGNGAGLSVTTWADLEEYSSDQPQAQKTYTSCFGKDDQNTLVYGLSNSGKSFLALSIALARACGTALFDFKATKQLKVLVIDAETPKDKFAENLKRISSALNCNKDLIESQFSSILLKSASADAPSNLGYQELKDYIARIVQEKKIELIVFDNLISLIPNFRSRGLTAWTDLREWIQTLRVSCVIVHHSNKDDNPAGTMELEDLCQTVIQVTGKAQLLEEVNKKFKEDIALNFGPFLEQDGLLQKITFKKCKSFPRLEGKPFGAFLKYNPENPSNGDPWHVIELNASNLLDSGLSSHPNYSQKTIQSQYPDLSTREHKVMMLAHKEETFVRKAVDDCLKCSESTSINVLKSLIDTHGLLEKTGTGKSTLYRLAVKLPENKKF